MKKPEASIWWVPGGDSRIEQQEGYGHCQSLPPALYQKEKSIKFIPESKIEALIESKVKEQREGIIKSLYSIHKVLSNRKYVAGTDHLKILILCLENPPVPQKSDE